MCHTRRFQQCCSDTVQTAEWLISFFLLNQVCYKNSKFARYLTVAMEESLEAAAVEFHEYVELL